MVTTHFAVRALLAITAALSAGAYPAAQSGHSDQCGQTDGCLTLAGRSLDIRSAYFLVNPSLSHALGSVSSPEYLQILEQQISVTMRINQLDAQITLTPEQISELATLRPIQADLERTRRRLAGVFVDKPQYVTMKSTIPGRERQLANVRAALDGLVLKNPRTTILTLAQRWISRALIQRPTKLETNIRAIAKWQRVMAKQKAAQGDNYKKVYEEAEAELKQMEEQCTKILALKRGQKRGFQGQVDSSIRNMRDIEKRVKEITEALPSGIYIRESNET